jgi:hypothetical protein
MCGDLGMCRQMQKQHHASRKLSKGARFQWALADVQMPHMHSSCNYYITRLLSNFLQVCCYVGIVCYAVVQQCI